jgi:hypothetical protein
VRWPFGRRWKKITLTAVSTWVHAIAERVLAQSPRVSRRNAEVEAPIICKLPSKSRKHAHANRLRSVLSVLPFRNGYASGMGGTVVYSRLSNASTLTPTWEPAPAKTEPTTPALNRFRTSSYAFGGSGT